MLGNSQSYILNFTHVDSRADSHAMLRVFRELILKQNGETCIQEAVACICFVDECEFKVAVFRERRLEKNRSGMICFRAQLCGNYARILQYN